MATAWVIHSLQTGGRPGSVSAAAGADLVKVYNGTVGSVERYTQADTAGVLLMVTLGTGASLKPG